jgi:putative aminopeptidase FrvX
MLGVPTVALAFATRYTHSPYETVAEHDLQLCVDLLYEFVIRSPLTYGIGNQNC